MKTLGKVLLIIGAFLTVITIVQLIISGQLTDVDAIEINNPNKITFYWSPITAVAFLIAGAAILIIRRKEKRRVHRYYR